MNCMRAGTAAAILWALLGSGSLGAQETQEAAETQAPFGALNIAPDKVSVSGISSGAFMAMQLHVAHSERIMGVGLVAGGLYACAVWRIDEIRQRLNGSLTRALDRCLETKAPLEPVEVYRDRMARLAAAGLIDPLAGLAGDKVYLFTGRADDVVDPRTVEHTAALYRLLGVASEDLAFQHFLDRPDSEPGAGHSWVTEDCCQPCNANASPYINNCGYDQAGEILRHIYGDLQPRAEALSGAFISFDQAEFVPEGKTTVNGLGDTGQLYVPASCAAGASCKLHVVLHGCRQTSALLGDIFYTKVGVNEWADSNDIVVLYPQAAEVLQKDLDEAFPQRIFRNSFFVNPRSCWNWWGYSYDDRFALKGGVQVSALHGMIERLLGEAGR